jgi:hypothetical protein
MVQGQMPGMMAGQSSLNKNAPEFVVRKPEG